MSDLTPSTDLLCRPTFLSYSRQDRAFAVALYDELKAADIPLWRDVHDIPAGSPNWWGEIRAAIDGCSSMVLCLSLAALQSTVVSDQWNYAQSKGKRIIPVIADEVFEHPDVLAGKVVVPMWMCTLNWLDLRPCAPEREAAFANVLKTLRTPYTPQPVHITVKAFQLPPNFVPRPREFEPLVRALAVGDPPEAMALTAALRGAGGYGKTVLAKALCRDWCVSGAFPDGIYWVTLGERLLTMSYEVRQSELIRRLRDLAKEITGERPNVETLEAAQEELAKAVASRRCMIVIDDVWAEAHVKWFLVPGKHHATVITTRFDDCIPRGAGVLRQRVDEMAEEDALALLAYDVEGWEEQRAWFQDTAKRLGYTAQLLGIVNGVITMRLRGDHGRPKSLADALQEVDERLDYYGVIAFDAEDREEREKAFGWTLEVGIEVLKPKEQQRYRELGTFPEDVPVPLTTLGRLWALDGRATLDFCEKLARGSLVQDYDEQTLTVHDVTLKYLRQTLPNAPEVHTRLLDAWGDPYTLPDDYAWRYYAYHLREAGWADALRALLLDFRWLQVSLDATDIGVLLGYFVDLTSDEPLRLIESAISMSAHAIEDDKHQFAGQLVGRLIGHCANHPKLESFVEHARTCESHPTLLPQLPTLTPAGGPLIRTILLQGTCNAIAFTEDGEHAVVAAFSRVNVFELATGALLTSFSQTQHRTMVTQLAVQGEIVVSGDNENTVKVWRWRDGTLLTDFTQHTDEISAVAVQGDIVVSGDNGGMVKVWRWENGELVTDFSLHTERVNAVAVQGDIVVSGAWDRAVKVWRWADGALVTDFNQHADRVFAVAIQGEVVVSGSADGMMKAWRWRDGTRLTEFTQHTGAGAIFAVAIQSDIVVSGDGGSTVKVWRWEDGELLTDFTLHTGVISAVAVVGNIIISGSCPDNIVKVWRWRNGRVSLADFKPHGDIVNAIAVQGDVVVSGSFDHTVKMWWWKDGALLKEFKFHTWHVSEVVVQDDIIIFAWGHLVRVCRRDDGALLTDFRRHFDEVLAVAVQGDIVVSGSRDHTVKIWRWRDGTLLADWRPHSECVNALAVQDDMVVSGSADHTVKVWRWEDGALLTDFRQHAGPVYAVAVQGDIVVSGGSGPHFRDAVKVWRWRDGSLLTDFAQHTGGVTGVAIQGEVVVSGSDDGTVKVWHWGTGEVLATFTADALIRSLAIDLNRHVIVAGDFSGHVHVLRPNAALWQLMAEQE